MVAALMDDLLNVYVPACAAIGWLVRRCYWQGRERGTGCWAAQCLQHCFLILCGLLGEKVRLSEYARSIGIALLTWTSWHDQVPASAYVEEACEAQLSSLSSALKRNPHAVGVSDVHSMYVLLDAPAGHVHAAKHHPVSHNLQHSVQRHLETYIHKGPEVVTHTPWRSGKTCSALPSWPATTVLTCTPWSTTDSLARQSLLHVLSRVHRGDDASTSIADLCNDFLQRSTQADQRAHTRALHTIGALCGADVPMRAPRAVVRQLTLRDRTDPPPKRRRTDAPRRVRTRQPPPPVDDLSVEHPAYTGPRFVGIPND
jgi:hypothetical protein